jgi:hypothetical protein
VARSASVRVAITGDARDLERVTRQADHSLERVNRAGRRVGHGLKVGLAAAGVAMLGMAEAAKKSVETVEELGTATIRFSRITGASNKVASEWIEQAKVRGIETNKLTTAFNTYSKQVTAANAGTKASVEAFKRLGVSQETLQSQDFDKTIAEISNGFAKLPNGAEKSALATKLFGKQAQLLMPLLQDGSKALQEQLDTAGKYGAVMGDHVVKTVKESAEAQRNLHLAMDGVQIFIGTKLLPIIDKLLKGFVAMIDGIRNGKGQFAVLHAVLAGIVSVTTSVVQWLGRHKTALSVLGVAVTAIVAALGLYKAGVIAAATASKVAAVASKAFAAGVVLVNLAMDANPIVLVGAAIVALGAALVVAYKKSATFRRVVNGAFEAVKTVVGAVVQFIRDRLADVLGLFQKIYEAGSHLPVLGDKFKRAAQGVQALRNELTGVDTALKLARASADFLTASLYNVFTQAQRAREATPPPTVPHHRAAGGSIPGHGSGDIVPAMLEPGEFVVRKAAVNKVGLGFMHRLNSGGLRGFQSGGPVAHTSNRTFSHDELAQLWIKAGGDPAKADLMAAIAQAESGGNSGARNVNGDGSIDRGPWQINSAWKGWSRYGGISNAKSAVHVYKTQGLDAWRVYSRNDYQQYLTGKSYSGQQATKKLHNLLSIAKVVCSKFGLTITSGYRSPEHNAAVHGAPNSWHMRGTPSNPGAVDMAGSMSAMTSALAWVKQNVHGLAEAMIDDVGNGPNLHIAGLGASLVVSGGGAGGTGAAPPLPKVGTVVGHGHGEAPAGWKVTGKEQYNQSIADLSVQAAKAGLTPGSHDDIAVLKGQRQTLRGRLHRIRKLLKRTNLTPQQRLNLTNEKADILGQLGGIKTSLHDLRHPDTGGADAGQDPTQALADAIAANTEATQAVVAAQQADTALRARIFGSQDGTIAAAVADMVSGGIGGRVGLGVQTPSFAGARTRY